MTANLTQLANDPAGGMGFNHAVLIDGKLAVPFASDGQSCRGNNSVRTMDGVVWDYLWQNDGAEVPPNGINNRDNHASYYIDAIDRFLIWGGSHLEACVGAYWSGAFDSTDKTWTERGANGSLSAISKYIKGAVNLPIDPGCAWNKETDMGLSFGGTLQGNPLNTCYLIRGNRSGGPQLYEMLDITNPAGPMARDQAMNLVVAGGRKFYLVAGNKGNWTFTNDLWEFDCDSTQWKRLPDPPTAGYQSCANFDSDRGEVVVWVYGSLIVYNVASNKWRTERTDLPVVMNQIGCYLPSKKLHVFSGGTDTNGVGNYATYGIELEDTVLPGLDIPPRTWVRRPLVQGMPAGMGGSKHLRICESSVDGKFYIHGGDWTYGPQDNHCWMGLRSYDPVTDQWAVEYPVLGVAGEIMPPGCDEVGWVEDTKRDYLWSLPGYTQIPGTPGGAQLPIPVGTVVPKILAFDRANKKWLDPGVPHEPFPGQLPKNGVYDAQTDTIWRCGTDQRGIVWSALDLTNKTWSQYQTPYTSDGVTYINNSDLQFEYLALDPVGRVIYAIDPIFYRLFAFSIESKGLQIKAPLPVVDPVRIANLPNPTTLSDLTQVAFDTTNRKLFYSFWTRVTNGQLNDAAGIITLIIYDPPTNTYEIDQMIQPQGMVPRGNSFAYGKKNNVSLFVGGLGFEGGSDYTLTHCFLYKWGPNGSEPEPPQGNVELTPEVADNEIQVGFTDGPGNPWDWVGLYPIGGAGNQYLDWFYTDNTKVKPAQGKTAGKLIFPLLPPQQYEARFYQNDSVAPDDMLGIAPFQVGGQPPPDTTKPQVTIVSPANNATVAGTIDVTAEITDNIGVVKGELYLDGMLKNTDTVAPYHFMLDTKAVPNGSHQLSVVGYDPAGNTGNASIAVNVLNTSPEPGSYVSINTNQETVIKRRNKANGKLEATVDKGVLVTVNDAQQPEK